MFRSKPYLEETKYVQINLDTPLTFPGNNQFQTKTGNKFTVRDRDNFYDWYNGYFRVDYNFEAKANGGNAGFNSTCYHPPRAHPRGFAIFFLLGGLFPTPGHAERDNSRAPGLLIDHKYVVLCLKLISVQ